MIEPGQHMDRARRNLLSGRYLLAGDFTEQAGRDAYLAAFHAAQAFIISRTGKYPKTHSGTRSEFARLTREEPRIGRTYVAFLGSAYELKTVADYEGDEPVSPDEATAALDTATQFVDLIASLLPPAP